MLEPSSSEEEDEDYMPPNYGQTLEPPGVRQNHFFNQSNQATLELLTSGSPEWGPSESSFPWEYVC